MTHVLIVTEVCNTSFHDLGFETFDEYDGTRNMIYAVGTEKELKALVESWATREVHPKPHPPFTAYMAEEGFEVGGPVIVRIGRRP